MVKIIKHNLKCLQFYQDIWKIAGMKSVFVKNMNLNMIKSSHHMGVEG